MTVKQCRVSYKKFPANVLKVKFTEPSQVSPVQQQAAYDSVFHQLQ